MTDEKKKRDWQAETGEQKNTGNNPHPQSSTVTLPFEDVGGVQYNRMITEAGTNVDQRKIAPANITPDEKHQPKSKKKIEVISLEDFIANAYRLKGRKISLTVKEQKKIAKDLTLSEDAKQRLLEMVQKDKMLMVPRQLLLAARNADKYPQLRLAIFNFVREILVKHPLFQQQIVESAIRNVEDAPKLNQVLKAIMKSSIPILTRPNSTSIKNSEFNQLRVNAANCIAVLLSEKKEMTIFEIADALYMTIWEQEAQLLKDDHERLRVLTDIMNFKSLGLACGLYQRKEIEAKQTAEEATQEAIALRDKVMELEEDNKIIREELIRAEEVRKNESELFENKISNICNQAETEKTHLRDDKEKLRTRVMRRLKSDLQLLEDGLHSMRRPEPKTHILIDVTERVSDALRKEIKNLEGG